MSGPNGKVLLAWDPCYYRVTKIKEKNQVVHSKVVKSDTDSGFLCSTVYE